MAVRRSSSPGDYKRRPTHRAPFELVACDLLVTEATFGLPVFRTPSRRLEIGSGSCLP